MKIDLFELWRGMGLPVRLVVILLTLQAMACVAVAIDRFVLLNLSVSRARGFAGQVRQAVGAGDHPKVLSLMSSVKINHLASYLELGLRTFLARQQAGDNAALAAELTQRALERKGDAISRDMNRGMNVLASTGSTAPFVGLLGTVLGIINAFKLIGDSGSGGLGTIGVAIAEALVVTGYGLSVAIPTVLIFNWLSAKIANYEAGLINAGAELVDQLRTGAVPVTVGSDSEIQRRRGPRAVS
jgi:biopolymer transport protein ExbB/TolQ